MAVVFSILGKILYILLMIICILLFLVLVLLVCPVRYQGTFEKEEELSAKGMIRWLFFLIYLPFSYEHGKFHLSVRIFGIPFFREGKRERKRKKKKAAVERAELTVMEKDSGEKVPEEPDMGKADSREPVSGEMVSEEQDVEMSDSGGTASEEQDLEMSDSGGTASEEQDVETSASAGSVPEQEEKKHIFDRIREKSTLFTGVKGFLKEENTKQTICIIKDNVVHLLKKLKPRKIKGYIEFGTGDPCQTGQVLAGLACLYAYYGRSVEIVPDFMEKKLSGHLYVKGRIALLTILIPLLRVVLSRGFKKFRKEVKELKEAM